MTVIVAIFTLEIDAAQDLCVRAHPRRLAQLERSLAGQLERARLRHRVHLHRRTRARGVRKGGHPFLQSRTALATGGDPTLPRYAQGHGGRAAQLLLVHSTHHAAHGDDRRRVCHHSRALEEGRHFLRVPGPRLGGTHHGAAGVRHAPTHHLG